MNSKGTTPIAFDSNNPKSIELDPVKVFEVEVNIMRDEIGRRLDFERRLQNVQITFIGILVAGYANITAGAKILSYETIDVIVAAILAVNTVFILEIRQNAGHVLLAAIYLKQVINRKYSLDSAFLPLGWELMLSALRSQDKSVFRTFSFVKYPVVLTSAYLFLVPTLGYFYNLIGPNKHRFNYIVFLTIIISSCISTVAIWDIIKERKKSQKSIGMNIFVNPEWHQPT